jgi:predicted GNAT superfamily acetyltransferase
MNADDESDRLVVVWPLTAPRSVDCSEGRVAPLESPDLTHAMIREFGPDGDPVVVDAQGATWVRVPRDIVKLRAEDPTEARAWRLSTRSILTTAFAAGYTATGATKTGWYRLQM